MGLLTLPLSLQAQNLDQWLKTLDKPVAPKVECEDETPEYCEDFFSYTCNQFDQTPLSKKIPETQDTLDQYFNSLIGKQKDPQVWSETHYSLYTPAVDKVAARVTQSYKITEADLQETYARAKAQLPPEAQNIKLLNATQAMAATKVYGKEKYNITSNAELEGEVVAAYNKTCGTGGTKAQIFTLPKTFVHVCPGFYWKLAEKSFSKEEMLRSLELLFLHELNHTMALSTPSTKIQACYQGKVGVTGYDAFTKAQKTTAWKNQSEEIMADTLASKNLNAKFKKLNVRGEAAAKILAGHMRLLCSQGADTFEKTHPGARFRMNIFAGNNQMREIIGCKPKAPTLGNCSL